MEEGQEICFLSSSAQHFIDQVNGILRNCHPKMDQSYSHGL